jgi:NitT/TauT family transport system permease protein
MTDVRDDRVRYARGLDDEIAGLDALDFPASRGPSRGTRIWKATWPKLAAFAMALLVWQLVVWSHWRPDYVLPGPLKVFPKLFTDLGNGKLITASSITLRRAAVGFAIATFVGLLLGVAVSRWRTLRVAFGSFITGLQTMPSIAWFPLAILLFKKSEGAITFVVVLGAAPAIANGVIGGADHVAPLLTRSGKVLGARGLNLYRTVTLPASLPSILGGMKQGWAFAWRSLMAGELLVIIPKYESIGARLQNARDLADAPQLLSTMLVILAIGILVDALVFANAEHAIRKRWGLIDSATG